MLKVYPSISLLIHGGVGIVVMLCILPKLFDMVYHCKFFFD